MKPYHPVVRCYIEGLELSLATEGIPQLPMTYDKEDPDI